MKAALIALFATGCTFSVNLDMGNSGGPIDARDGEPVADGPRVDATPTLPIDAPPDGPLAWTEIESFAVPCTGATITSTSTLAVNTTYRLRASGSCVTNTFTTSRADAEFVGYNITTPLDSVGGNDIGLAINDTTLGMTKAPDWGAYQSSHDYTATWMGLGARITAMFQEPDYLDNAGQLTLAIDAFQ